MTVRINGKALPESAIEFELERLVKFYAQHFSEDSLQERMDELRNRAREQAIGGVLLREEAERLDVRVPEAQVQARIDAMTEKLGGEEAFRHALQRQGLDRKQLRGSIAVGLRIDALVAKITADSEEPAEAELRAYYDAHADEYMQPELARVRHILVKPDSDKETDRAVAESKLLEIRSRIEGGADLSDMAAAHSDCPSGARSGGSLGWIGRGTMVPEFDAAVFSLRVGELSEPVETPLGLHLLYKDEQTPARPADYADVRDKIRDLLRHSARGRLLTEYVEDLKERAEIVEE